MSIECGECERDLRGGHEENCSIKLEYERTHPPCPKRCPCGNPCVLRVGGIHTAEYQWEHYKLRLAHYCDECIDEG